MKMKTLFLLLVLTTTSVTFASGRAGNGGFIDKLIEAELRDRNVLSDSDIDKIVENVGEELKTTVLIPLFDKFFIDTELSNELLLIRDLLSQSKEKLYLDLKITHIKIGECINGATTCTGNNPFSDIYIDKEALLNSTFGASITELISLLTHEFLHHYYTEIPNHNSYPLARKMKSYLTSQTYKSITYETIDLVITLPIQSRQKAILRIPNVRKKFSDQERKETARRYCIFKGHKDLHSFRAGEYLTKLERNQLKISRNGSKSVYSLEPYFDTYAYMYTLEYNFEFETYKWIKCIK